MSSKNVWDNENLIKTLLENGVAVMPTDTIYGMVGKAQNESTVSRIYAIRNRNSEKPCIILIGDLSELDKFSINITESQKDILKEFWPGPVSIVLDCPDESLSYLHRGTKTLAFRMPRPEGLRSLLVKVGPLVAPSANMEKFPSSESISDAKGYFGDKVDLYVDGGVIGGKASKVIKLNTDGTINVLRV